jgi:hypothetical protein
MSGPYHFDYHPDIPFDKDCNTCHIGRLRQEHNVRALEREEPPQYAIAGNGPVDLNNIKLIVVSDYPGMYEVQRGYPMVDKFDFKPDVIRGKVQPRNAGGFLRRALELMYGLDSYEDVWITNAVKCNPASTALVETKHVRPCVRKWLSNEMGILDKHCPRAPILSLGTQAYRALRYLYKDKANSLEAGYTASRRKIHWAGDRPIVISFNPAIAARSEPRIETVVKETKKGVYISKTDWLYPPLPNSPVDRFIKDLRCLAEVLDARPHFS